MIDAGQVRPRIAKRFWLQRRAAPHRAAAAQDSSASRRLVLRPRSARPPRHRSRPAASPHSILGIEERALACIGEFVGGAQVRAERK
jgi:hypothetical protein